MNVLFVCTGNTCRSPMAEGFFNSIYGSGAKSAGIYTEDGAAPSENAVKAMKKYGIDISEHKAKQISPEDIINADKIYAMTTRHAAILKEIFPEKADNIFILGNGIPDPFGGDEELYLKCAEEIKKFVSEIEIK